MGGCCAREQEVYFDKKNCYQYSKDEIIKINPLIKPELKFERKKANIKTEEIQLSKIINELKKIFKDKVTTITEIELFNLAIYNKESFINSDYLIFDMRKSCEQKEEYLKRIKHINYTYEQIKKIEKIHKLEILQNFINGRKIILIIPEYYLNPKNNKEGFRNVETYPIELCHLLYNINNTICFKVLNCCLNKNEEQPNKFEDYLSVFHSYDDIPFILFSYLHVTTLYKEGYFFISFSNVKLFSFDDYIIYLVQPENMQINELSFKNKFISEMNIACIINIDNYSKKLFEIKDYQYQKNIYKEVIINKYDISIKKEKILELCEWIKMEIKKGHSCYFNIENFENENNNMNGLNLNNCKNNWIFVIIILIAIIAEVDALTVINYLEEKMIYINDINEIINDGIKNDEIKQTLTFLNN